MLQEAKRSLNSSSDTPAQLRASAKEPVTVPVLAVSFAASVNPSNGKESPNVAYTPAAMLVHCDSCSSLSHSLARWFEASTAVSVSPSSPTKLLYVLLAASDEYPACSKAVSSFDIELSVSDAVDTKPATDAVTAANPATAAVLTLDEKSFQESPMDLVDESVCFSTSSVLFLTPSSSFLAAEPSVLMLIFKVPKSSMYHRLYSVAKLLS